MARPTKLTPELVQQIEGFLGIGCTVEVVCNAVGIAKSTFYKWKHESEGLCELAEIKPPALITADQLALMEFSDALTRAQARAHVVATMAIHSALTERRYTEIEPYTYTEVRLRKDKDGLDVPYTYQETRMRQVEHVIPADWRAGVEFLKRRDPAAWQPATKVEVTFEEKAIKYIRDGEVTFEAMARHYGRARAVDLFRKAGVPISSEDDDDQDEL